MTLLAIINDVHIGARSDSEVIQRHQRLFYETVFYPYLEQHAIDTMFVLGDLFERRKFINFKSLAAGQEMIFDPALRQGIEMHVSLGNHDVVHRSTNQLNSPGLLLRGYTNVILYPSKLPRSYKCPDGEVIDVIPWITEDNSDAVLDYLYRSTSKVVFGHFDITGFEMVPGHLCEAGLEPKVFEKFDLVLTGHYHLRSSKGNIHYLGTQYDMDWGDYGQVKGFHLFDTVTKALTFVPNPVQIFAKTFWGDGNELDASTLRGKFVKLVVQSKADETAFQKYLDAVIAVGPADLSVIEPNTVVVGAEEDDVRLQSTTQILHQCAQQIEAPNMIKQRVSAILAELHQEAMSCDHLL